MMTTRLLVLPAVLISPSLWAGEPLTFNKDIRPILSENCFYCHGQDGNKREASLRLDVREAAIEKQAFIPGDSAASELIKRVLSSDNDEQMPPPKSHRRLSTAQKETLQRWINEGAVYEKHWAFSPPARPPVPSVKNAAWARNEIDKFILAKLQAADLVPSPEAERHLLIRRLSMDLTGLPPLPEEADAFANDPAPDAYEKLVDKLMASPHYGERMAIPWLDAARYADSNGFQQDGDTHQYIWRDWVVNALNADMPYDQFSIEQLAGDLLPEPTENQLIATAFNRNHMLNGEGGAIPEEQRNNVLFDRVDTTATTWMGLTMACAQCHDHKYDPLTQREYYSIMAFFNNVPESGVPSGSGQYRVADPSIPVAPEADKQRLKNLEAAHNQAKAEESQATGSAETVAAIETTIKSLKDPLVWATAAPQQASASDGVRLSVLEDHSIFAEGERPDKANYVVNLPALAGVVTGLRIETIPDLRLPSKGAGRSDSGNAVLTKLRLTAGGKEIRFHAASATYTQGGFSPEGVIDDDPNTAWAFYPETAHPYFLTLQTAEPVPAGNPLVVTMEFQSPHKQHQLGRFRIQLTSGSEPAARHSLPDDISALLRQPADQSPEAAAKIKAYVLKNMPPKALAAAREKQTTTAKSLENLRNSLPRIMVMSDKQPRQTKILDRGNYLTPSTDVTPGTPVVLGSLPPGAPQNRLGFARWLFSPEHPLTARVQVNRFWQYFFGIGLVKTAEDLGVQSELPLHQELLDWLSVEFRERGWSSKHIVRLILTSSTYRQSSRISPQQLQQDPENRLTGRAARFRMPSLVLRDAALAASGLLDQRIGGKPVYPYQPDEIWETLAITKERDFTYPASTGPDLYRRSLYTFWRRTIGPANMFDASARQTCKVRLAVTSTPLHALTTLNDLTWVEAARVLAGKAMKASPDVPQQITWAFRRVLTRPPVETETALLTRAFEKQLARYSNDPKAAEAFIARGNAPRDTSLPPASHAAMSAVCLALFNTDETLTRE